jgi:hypothetical protein
LVQEVVEDCPGECRFPGSFRAFDERNERFDIVFIVVRVAVGLDPRSEGL